MIITIGKTRMKKEINGREWSLGYYFDWDQREELGERFSLDQYDEESNEYGYNGLTNEWWSFTGSETNTFTTDIIAMSDKLLTIRCF